MSDFNFDRPDSQVNRDLLNKLDLYLGRPAGNNIMHSIFNGFRTSQSGYAQAPVNTETTPLVFFTKPMLNLSYDNIGSNRYLSFLSNPDPLSTGCAIKCMLSPKILAKGLPYDPSPHNVRSAHVNDNLPFIPLLTNLHKNISGWPDRSIDVYSSPEGIRKQVCSHADGFVRIFGEYDLNITFRNVEGDPLQALFCTMLEWMSEVCSNNAILPYLPFRMDKTKDYEMAIWEIILDGNQHRVLKMTRGIGFPVSFPDGSYFNSNKSNNVSRDNDEISVPFKMNGASHNDPILPKEFNMTVELAQPKMRRAGRKSGLMIPIPKNKEKWLVEHGYPRIERDRRFQWYAEADLVNSIKGV